MTGTKQNQQSTVLGLPAQTLPQLSSYNAAATAIGGV
jgi:hypothetical protein